VDRVLGSLLQELDSRGLRDNTLIVLAADHGEAFGEHGREGHARDVYGEVTTTPFILNFPFRLEGGAVVESSTENVDLWPTLLDLLGLPGLEAPDGRSRVPELLAAVRGEPSPPSDTDNFAYIDQTWGRSKQASRPMVAVGDGRYRLLHRAASGQGELFDRSIDALEAEDIAEEEPEIYARLTERAQEYLARSPAWEESEDVELGESELEQLRALGYDVQ